MFPGELIFFPNTESSFCCSVSAGKTGFSHSIGVWLDLSIDTDFFSFGIVLDGLYMKFMEDELEFDVVDSVADALTDSDKFDLLISTFLKVSRLGLENLKILLLELLKGGIGLLIGEGFGGNAMSIFGSAETPRETFGKFTSKGVTFISLSLSFLLVFIFPL